MCPVEVGAMLLEQLITQSVHELGTCWILPYDGSNSVRQHHYLDLVCSNAFVDDIQISGLCTMFLFHRFDGRKLLFLGQMQETPKTLKELLALSKALGPLSLLAASLPELKDLENQFFMLLPLLMLLMIMCKVSQLENLWDNKREKWGNQAALPVSSKQHAFSKTIHHTEPNQTKDL